MKRRMEVSQHCWKFIYKHSDISIFAVCHLFYFFYLRSCGKNIFTNKFSSSGIYRYFNSSVRRVKQVGEKNKMQGFAEHLIGFPNEFNTFNNTGARMQDSIYHKAEDLHPQMTILSTVVT